MRRIVISLVATAVFLSVALGAAFGMGGQTKIELCHFPPGNPDNAHTIRVGEPSMAAHMAHGDWLGGTCSEGSGYGYGYGFR